MGYKLAYKTYLLQHKHVFRISRAARTVTPVVLIRLEFDGIFGYGEASMPPLYGESHDTAVRFLQKVNLNNFNNPFDIEGIMQYVDQVDTGNTAIKAAIDIALNDIAAKLKSLPVYAYLGLPKTDTVVTSKTIGIDSPGIIKERVKAADEFKILKIKLGTENDKMIINAVREVTDKPLYVDANQGWKDKNTALDMIKWLSGKNVLLIEQPMPVDSLKELAWLKLRSPLPIIGDEGVQRLKDVENAEQFYHGINVKLVKSTGLTEGLKMLKLAKQKGLKTMIGCMAETSCSISAAFHLTSQCDYVDLDGNLGITNNPYSGIETLNGQLINNDVEGIGLIHPEKEWKLISNC